MKNHMNKSITAKFRILLLALAVITIQGSALHGSFEWLATSGSANWEDSANWKDSLVPDNAVGAEVFFLASSGDTTVVTSGASTDITLGILKFNASNSFTITGSKDLIFSSGGAATLFDDAGNHSIETGVVLVNDLSVTVKTGLNLSISGAISGSGGIITSEIGTLTLSGSNTYTGTTLVDKGSLNLASSGTAIASGTITINDSGTLLLGAANQIGSSDLSFNGGNFSTGGFSDTIGTLTLDKSSTIDFGSGASVLDFSTAGTFGASTVLTINNWTGNIGFSGGTDQLIFSTTVPDTGQLAQISFVNPGSQTGTFAGFLVGSEVVPVPEASSMIGAALLSALIILDILRRKQRRKELTEAAA